MTDLSDLQSSDSTGWQGPMPAGWLQVSGNRIEWADGKPFHGRGATVHDTRSCWACAYQEPNPAEAVRRMDELIDGWGANFLRLALESYSERPEYGVQWKGVLDDSVYLDDVTALVRHVGTKPGVVVLVNLWYEPTFTPQGWPSAATREVWKKLATVLVDAPYVMFGLVDGVTDNADGSQDAQAWQAMNETVETIRAVEFAAQKPPHVIVVQGTRSGGADVRYYVDHPITAGGGRNIAYQANIYEAQSAFSSLVTEPAQRIPMVIGAFGPTGDMSLNDCQQLMNLAESMAVPYLAWTFHMRCSQTMNMLVDYSNGGCGVGMSLEPTAWGQVLKNRLAQPW